MHDSAVYTMKMYNDYLAQKQKYSALKLKHLTKLDD